MSKTFKYYKRQKRKEARNLNQQMTKHASESIYNLLHYNKREGTKK
jgi:hypothetical protein